MRHYTMTWTLLDWHGGWLLRRDGAASKSLVVSKKKRETVVLAQRVEEEQELVPGRFPLTMNYFRFPLLAELK
jgi:hypothetical protein